MLRASKRVLVTGGFGFLGSHLVEELLRDETLTVHVVDNLSSNPVPLNHLWYEWGGTPERLSFDLCPISEFLTQKGTTFDVIYHLASVVGPVGVLSRAGFIAQDIINDAVALASLAIKCNAKLLDVSTSEVYGGGQEGLCAESMSKVVHEEVTVRSEYAAGKLASEVALVNMSKVSSLDVCIVRPFNIAGPRQSGKGGFVLPRFVAQVLMGKPLTVFGAGSQIRAFCHVKDIVGGLIKVMRRGRRGEIYNLGNPENRISISDLADLVIKVSGFKGSKTFVDPKKLFGPLFAEANDKFPDTRKAVAELDWNPRFTIREIVCAVINYMCSVDAGICKHLAGG